MEQLHLSIEVAEESSPKGNQLRSPEGIDEGEESRAICRRVAEERGDAFDLARPLLTLAEGAIQ